VAATRSPIGRAFKGSLKDTGPDQLAAMMVQAALDQVPELDPTTIDDLMLGCGMPGGEPGWNMARVVAVLLGLDGLPGVLLLLQPDDHARHPRLFARGPVLIGTNRDEAGTFFADPKISTEADYRGSLAGMDGNSAHEVIGHYP
jgi:hypothetical protein